MKSRTPADTIGARVIGAPLSAQFRVLRLRIDRGEREVAPGMPVISGAGPVGRIDKVYGAHADVLLISDPSSRLEVVIPETEYRKGMPDWNQPVYDRIISHAVEVNHNGMTE